ncbi:hypothetical protein [Pseudomonas sp. Marseille-QA0332]
MRRQRGIVLLVGLVLALLLGLLAASAMRGALLETRKAGDLLARLQAFEQAEAVLLEGLALLQSERPAPCTDCLPPERPHEVERQPGAWTRSEHGYLLLQNLGDSTMAGGLPADTQVTLLRITAVSRQVRARQVLEAVYAVPVERAEPPQRVLWRQRFRAP